MSDAITTDVFLLFDVKKIADDMDDGVLKGSQEAAEEGVKHAERLFKGKERGTGTGETSAGFFDFKSFYRDGGWVFGTFNKRRGKWEDSVGGRAHFFEYGRSAPGKGRGKTGKPQPVRQRAQRPRPFMRPARNRIKRRLGGITSQELRKVARKLNRSKQLDSEVQRVVNKL